MGKVNLSKNISGEYGKEKTKKCETRKHLQTRFLEPNSLCVVSFLSCLGLIIYSFNLYFDKFVPVWLHWWVAKHFRAFISILMTMKRKTVSSDFLSCRHTEEGNIWISDNPTFTTGRKSNWQLAQINKVSFHWKNSILYTNK